MCDCVVEQAAEDAAEGDGTADCFGARFGGAIADSSRAASLFEGCSLSTARRSGHSVRRFL